MLRHLTFAVCGLTVSASASAATVVDLSGLADGTPLTNQVAGLTFSADNLYPDAGDFVKVWNLSGHPNTVNTGQNGPFLIGNNTGIAGNGLVRAGKPGQDFEKRRPAGSVFMDFADPVSSFSMTIIDVEGPEEFKTSAHYFLAFSSGGIEVQRIRFAELITAGSNWYDSSIVFGNRSANELGSFNASQFGVESFDRVEVQLGGSSVIAGVTYEAVPTPTALVAGLGLMGLAALKRRRENA